MAVADNVSYVSSDRPHPPPGARAASCAPYTDAVEQQDLERILDAIGHRDWWDYAMGATTAVAAIASVVIAVVAVRIARNAEAGRKAAEDALTQDRAESRLRGATRDLIEALSNHVQLLSEWGATPVEVKGRAIDAYRTLGSWDETRFIQGGHTWALVVEELTRNPRPRYDALRGALDTVTLDATPAAREVVERLQRMTLMVVVAPQWHAAAQHLSDISSAVDRWSARDEALPAFTEALDAIEAHYLDGFRQVDTRRTSYRPETDDE